MKAPFDKTITVYHRSDDDRFSRWHRKVIYGVYYGLETKMTTTELGIREFPSRNVVIPTTQSAISAGDIIILGECNRELDVNSSGNEIIKQGGWMARTIENNAYHGNRLSNIKASEV